MPFRNEETKRQYKQDWYLRKKAGLPTRITPKLTKEESIIKEKKRQKKYQQEKKQYLISIFGDRCKICGKIGVMIIHRKDGKPHKKIYNMSWEELKTEIENHKDEYVRVCGICHSGIHWAMKYLSLEWDNIPS